MHFLLGIIFLICSRIGAHIPISCVPSLGSFIGNLKWRWGKKRKFIARANMRLVFPQMDEEQRDALLRQSFCQNAEAFLWTFKIVFSSNSHYTLVKQHIETKYKNIKWSGDKKLTECLRKKQRVMILGVHAPLSAIASLLMTKRYKNTLGVYKALPYEALEKAYNAGYKRFVTPFQSPDVHKIRSAFTPGHILFFLADQNIRQSKQCLTSPFLGVPARTNVAPWRWAKMLKSECFVYHPIHQEDGTMHIQLFYLPDFYKKDAQQSLDALNNTYSKAIKAAPTEYDWTFARFRNIVIDGKNLYDSKKR